MREIIFLLTISTCIILLSANWLSAQNPQEERRIEEEIRKKLTKTELKILEGESKWLFDYGGWINYSYTDYKDDDNNSAVKDLTDKTYSLDTRLWLKATLRPSLLVPSSNAHSFYLRLKDYDIWRRPDETSGGDEHKVRIDYAYFMLNFNPHVIHIGRRYFNVGQGIAYSNVHDGIEFQASLADWNFNLFASHTLPDEDNIDTSVPGWRRSADRFFYGAQVTCLSIPNNSLYGYLVVQRDKSREDPKDPDHNYTYDSEYLGLGVEGKLLPGLRFWAELIKQTGKSYVWNSNEKKNINAWGGDFVLVYDWETKTHPGFALEYSFGSGDSDRVSVTNTLGGNISGNDKNFLYFGYLPTGYALLPRLSNLHVIRAGISLKPLEENLTFRDLTLGIDLFQYYKDESEGAIYDIDASRNKRLIGREFDLNLSWQIFSDLAWSLQYGHFQPRSAYPDTTDDSADYFFSSLSITF